MSDNALGIKNISDFTAKIIAWAKDDKDILGVALVGSYARNNAGKDSDIDLIILTVEPEKYLADSAWLNFFGEVSFFIKVEYGMVTSLHVNYTNTHEVEFGITLPDWANIPVDDGTREVVTDGMVILYDPKKLFTNLCENLRND